MAQINLNFKITSTKHKIITSQNPKLRNLILLLNAIVKARYNFIVKAR